ncbi:MAG TPA: bifunctional phosphoribosyl-AMP cyclohydrolase/phosphoribosyl-ATP diphosphatase HisIE [Methylomirabilota bacterium]|nr:bifunctional phosphoribosyl-AMP cyclohydrolase/phosphoribosyl-ATP diphosphatase HisIE [Methylomirabilota bacterium]
MTPPASPRFDADGLIPAVVQDGETGEVLMVAWMNAEALKRTLDTRLTHFWSRSRQTLWQKGATSGHRQHVEAVYADCDGDTLLVLAHPEGVACHTGSRTCFFTRVDEAAGGDLTRTPAAGPGILDVVERVIQSRRATPREGSYVSGLLAAGDARIAQKVGEEAAEVMVAALAEGSERLVAEVADLWFHTLVLMGARGLSARHVFAELARRHRPANGGPPGDGAAAPPRED